MREYLRRVPALLSVLLLSVPSAIGVYAALLPTLGALGALSAALGFECFYLGMSLIAFNGAWNMPPSAARSLWCWWRSRSIQLPAIANWCCNQRRLRRSRQRHGSMRSGSRMSCCLGSHWSRVRR